jgi:membrane dipeptidase
MNALEWNRDFTRPVAEIRAREQGMTDRPDRGNGTVSFEEMRRGGIGLCVATQIARYAKRTHPLPGWHSPEQAWAMTQAQLAWYREMERRGELVQIRDRADSTGSSSDGARTARAGPIGYVLSLEGADSIVTMRHLEQAVAAGLRALGPAHYGPGTYAYGTDSDGPLGARGRELLKEMDRHGLILDATHLCDTSFWEALEVFQGPVWASHSNCRALVPHNRQFSDEQLRALIDRGAVIGAALDAWMLVPGWERQVTTAGGGRPHAAARRSTTSITSARWPATPGTRRSAATSTAASAASRRAWTSRRSPTSGESWTLLRARGYGEDDVSDRARERGELPQRGLRGNDCPASNAECEDVPAQCTLLDTQYTPESASRTAGGAGQGEVPLARQLHGAAADLREVGGHAAAAGVGGGGVRVVTPHSSSVIDCACRWLKARARAR